GDVLALLLVGRHAFEPAQRSDRRKIDVQFGGFGRERWDEHGRFIRVESSGEPRSDHRRGVFVDCRRGGVIAGERMPIGDEMVALVYVLQLDPVFKRALVIAEVQTTRRAHSANDSLHIRSNHCPQSKLTITRLRTGPKISPKAPSQSNPSKMIHEYGRIWS